MRPRYMIATRSQNRLDDRQIVRNEQIGQAEPLAQFEQQVQHRRLHRHVEARGRLVEDHKARPQQQDAGERDAPQLAARQFVRVAQPGKAIETDRFEHRVDPLRARSADGDAVDPEAFFEGAADAPPRVERGGGILMDILDVRCAGDAPACGGRPLTTAPSSRISPAALALQAQHGAAERRLAAAGFADETEDLAGPNRQADPANRAHRRHCAAAASALPAEQHGDVAQFEDRARRSCADPLRHIVKHAIDPASGCPARLDAAGARRRPGARRLQRGAKRQPGGQRSGDGTAPGMPTNDSARSGWQASSARV